MPLRIFKSTAFAPISPGRVRIGGFDYKAFPVDPGTPYVPPGPPPGFTADAFLVGGGGAGCSFGAGILPGNGAGGGGAGGVVRELLAQAFDPTQTYSIIVGLGGMADAGTGAPGQRSSITGPGIAITATGGDEGTSVPSGAPRQFTGGPNEDFQGGTGVYDWAGGGAGATTNGGDGDDLTESGGIGGEGLSPPDIWNNPCTFPLLSPVGSGGGGGTNGTGDGGSVDGGGSGADQTHPAGAATKYGGGGGGGSQTFPQATSGNDGIVIIRYPAPQRWNGGTVCNLDSTVYHVFTSDGLLTPVGSGGLVFKYGGNTLTNGQTVDTGTWSSPAGCFPNILLELLNTASDDAIMGPTVVIPGPFGTWGTISVDSPIASMDFGSAVLPGQCIGAGTYDFSVQLQFVWSGANGGGTFVINFTGTLTP